MNFAPNHDNHDGRWVLCKDSLPLCIGCVVEILEDLDSTPTKQKHTLTAFLCLCSSKPAEVYSVLTPEDPATIHFLSLLHGLIWSQDRRLASIAVEAIVNMCSHVKSQDLMMSLLNSLITKILQTKPGAPIVAGLSLISHLCQAFPVLVPPLLLNQGEFVHYLLAALDVEDEEIQAAIVYTMSSVYGDGNLSVDLYYPLSHNILQLLDGAQSKQLLTNILGFLRKLLQQRPLTEKLMNYSGKVSLTSVLKKILLQTSDTSIRIAVVQSLCQILTHNEIYAETLLQADIAEFLYETLATMDHLLIGSVFCCLLLLSGCKDFYSKCHSVYGLEAIIRAIKHCIQANHVKEGAKGFQMLGEILAKQPEGIPIFTNANTPQQVFSLVSAGLRLHNKTLTISASIAMNSSLRVHHLGNKVDLEIIENTVQECLMEIKHQLSLSCKSRTQESLLRSMVLLLHQCFRLTLQWQESSLVKFNDKKSLEEFEIFLLQACDSSCIPSVVANYDNIKSEEVLANLFGMLSAANQMKIGGIQEFYEKLVSASFLQIALSVKSSCQNRPRLEHTVNGFVMSVCERLFAVDHQPDVQSLLMIMKTTFPTVKGDVQDMKEHLQEDNINGVTSEQIVYLTLLYLAACHGDRLCSVGPRVEQTIRLEQCLHSPPSCVAVVFLYSSNHSHCNKKLGKIINDTLNDEHPCVLFSFKSLLDVSLSFLLFFTLNDNLI
ncbi:meiosis inhibitor protein 1-like isoform X2 [Ptychodera flava]|uniref:meiosis inhibitor protein 1-like isoform X2 n=1 Tax=Ptychodera flava TaxID=63121 RepID=UPI00396A44CA